MSWQPIECCYIEEKKIKEKIRRIKRDSSLNSVHKMKKKVFDYLTTSMITKKSY